MIMKYTYRVRSGHHMARENGERVKKAKGETFTSDKPLHNGVFADKLELVKSNDPKEQLIDNDVAPLESEEPILDGDESEGEDDDPVTVDADLNNLKSMTVADLKEYAADLELDVTDCRIKSDFVKLIHSALQE